MKKFMLDGYAINIADELENYNKIRQKYDQLANSLSEKFKDEYSKNFKNIDELHEKCPDIFFTQYLKTGLDTAITDLISYQITNINESIFIEKYLSHSLTWEDDWNEIDEQYLEIVLNAEALDNYRTARRQNRTQWTGGGFGIEGAIKGSMKAGAINLTSNLVHGTFNVAAKGFSLIGDAIKKEKLFNDSELKNKLFFAVNWQIFSIHYALQDAINKNSTQIKVISPSSADIETAKAYLENIQKGRIDNTQIKELLVKAITLAPYNREIYEYWFDKYMDSSGELESIALFFGHKVITEKKRQVLAKFKASLLFSTPKNAQESWEKLHNKANEIGMPFSIDDVTREKRFILNNYVDTLDFSTSTEAEKNLPSLKSYAEALDFLDGYEQKKVQIEQSLIQKSLELKEADTLTNSTKQIVLLILTYSLLLLFMMMLAASIDQKNFIFALFSMGVIYACYTKISETKGTRATKLLHNLGHITVGFFTFFASTAIISPIIFHEESLFFATLIITAIGCGGGWHFYDIAYNRFKKQGITPYPQRFTVAAISGLIISMILMSVFYLSVKGKMKEEAPANNDEIAITHTETIEQTPPPKSTPVESTSIANTEVPFIGKRSFNFMGGTGTAYSITINQNGSTVVMSIGTESSFPIYEGDFQNPILFNESEGILFQDGKVYSVTDGVINKGCSGDEQEPCVSKLYQNE